MMIDLKTQSERRAKRFWVSLVVVLLGIQLVIGGVAIYLATSDPTVAVLPDYHNVALSWDQHRRINSAAERLGWEVKIDASDVADGRGMRAVEVTIADDAGRSVEGLSLRGTAYHHARASEVRSFDLKSLGDGKYLGLAPIGRAGLWQVEIAIDGADEPMKMTRTIEIARE